MQTKYQWVQRTIRATNPEDYDRKMNEALTSHFEAQIIDRLNDQDFCSIIRYKDRIEIPETIEEEYELQGIRHTCGECKHYRPSFDGRVKYTECPYDTTVSCWKDRHCCEYFWRMLKNGAKMLKEEIS